MTTVAGPTPVTLEFERATGDTYPFTIAYVDEAGVAIDCTDYTTSLVVGTDEPPALAAATDLFVLAGTFDTPTNGIASFTPTAPDAAREAATLYCRLYLVDPAGHPRCAGIGTWKVL